MLPDFFLERFDLPGELFIGREELSQMDEGSDNLDAGADRYSAPENVRKHHRPVFGEHARSVLKVLSPL